MWESAASNADGARLVQEGRYDAAFAGEFAAATYGLEPLVTDIHDAENAQTRFVLVGPPGPARRADRRGQDLRRAVAAATTTPVRCWSCCRSSRSAGVNLMRIESRPTGEGIGSYCFSIDAEGHITDRRVGEALMGLKRICREVRFLGSYPRADEVRRTSGAAARRPRTRRSLAALGLAGALPGRAVPEPVRRRHGTTSASRPAELSTEVIHRPASRPGDKSTHETDTVDKSAYRPHIAPQPRTSPFVHSFPLINSFGVRHSTRKSV